MELAKEDRLAAHQRRAAVSKAKDLTPTLLGEEWDSVAGATGPGWYAVSDKHVAGMGPFSSRKECEKAIQREIDRAR